MHLGPKGQWEMWDLKDPQLSKARQAQREVKVLREQRVLKVLRDLRDLKAQKGLRDLQAHLANQRLPTWSKYLLSREPSLTL